MEKEKSSLIVPTKNFFQKIKEFFVNIFKKQNHNYKQEKAKNNKDIQTVGANNKEDFFEKYNAYKANQLDISVFTGAELVKINAMLEEEIKINKEKFVNALNQYRILQNN